MLLSGCGSESSVVPQPSETPIPQSSVASTIPVIKTWLNQPCSPEGATAKTISGGDITCKKVGFDVVPEWHAEPSIVVSAPVTTTTVTKPTIVKTPAKTDPRFSTCAKAKSAGYGPYHRGQTEYTWYRDGDSDGVVCE